MEKLGRQLGLCAHPLHIRADGLQGELPISSAGESCLLASPDRSRQGSRSTSPGSRLQHLLHDWPRSRNCSASWEHAESRRKSGPPGVTDLRRHLRGAGHGFQVPDRGRRSCCACVCHRDDDLPKDTRRGVLTGRTVAPDLPPGGGDAAAVASHVVSPNPGSSARARDSTGSVSKTKDLRALESRVRSVSPAGPGQSGPAKSCTLHSARTEQTWVSLPRGESAAWSSAHSLGKSQGHTEANPQGKGHSLFKIFPMGIFRKKEGSGNTPTTSVIDTRGGERTTGEQSQSVERPSSPSDCPESSDRRHCPRTPALLQHAVHKFGRGEDTRNEKNSAVGSPSNSLEHRLATRKTSRDGPSRARCSDGLAGEHDGGKGRKVGPGLTAYEYTAFECELLGLQLRPLDSIRASKRFEDGELEKRSKRRRADGECASRNVNVLVGENAKEVRWRGILRWWTRKSQHSEAAL